MEMLEINNVMVCPFRTVVDIKVVQENGENIQRQITEFPECQYTLCPFYKFENKPICSRINIE